MSHLLLVEDDKSLGESLSERLTSETYTVTWADSCANAEHYCLEKKFDLAILDVGLPDGSGFELAKIIKKNQMIPILFLTASADAEDRLRGFELGAEEYIPKPFHIRELLIRLKRVLAHTPAKKIMLDEDTYLECESRTLCSSVTGAVPLSHGEFKTLALLLEKSPDILSREEILNHLYGSSDERHTRSVDNLIVKLRQLIGDKLARNLRSARKEGYQWLPSRAH